MGGWPFQRAAKKQRHVARFTPHGTQTLVIRIGRYTYTRIEKWRSGIVLTRVYISTRHLHKYDPGDWVVTVRILTGNREHVSDKLFTSEREAIESLAAELEIDPDSVR